MTEWRAGMEAVFVGRPEGLSHRTGDPVLEKGKIYIVEGVILASKGSIATAMDGLTYVMPQDMVYLGIMGKYTISIGFRPVQKRATDISVFHEMRRGVERVVKEKA